MPSHKPLKSVAHNFSHSFISLMNFVNDDYFLDHLLKQAKKTNLNKLTIDILQNSAEPIGLLTNEIKASIESWNKWFPSLVENSGSAMEFVNSAIMTIQFDLQQTRPCGWNKNSSESPFVCEILIIDDRGKKYKRKHEEWWC